MTVSTGMMKLWSSPLVCLDKGCCNGQQKTLLKDKKLSIKKKLCSKQSTMFIVWVYTSSLLCLVPSLPCDRCMSGKLEKGEWGTDYHHWNSSFHLLLSASLQNTPKNKVTVHFCSWGQNGTTVAWTMQTMSVGCPVNSAFLGNLRFT